MNAAALALSLWLGTDKAFGIENIYGLPPFPVVNATVEYGERKLAVLRSELEHDTIDPEWWSEQIDDLDDTLWYWRMVFKAYTKDEWGDIMPHSHRTYIADLRERLAGRPMPELPQYPRRLYAPWRR